MYISRGKTKVTARQQYVSRGKQLTSKSNICTLYYTTMLLKDIPFFQYILSLMAFLFFSPPFFPQHNHKMSSSCPTETKLVPKNTCFY